MRFTYPLDKTPIEYAEYLWAKALSYVEFYDKCILKGYSTKELQ